MMFRFDQYVFIDLMDAENEGERHTARDAHTHVHVHAHTSFLSEHVRQ